MTSAWRVSEARAEPSVTSAKGAGRRRPRPRSRSTSSRLSSPSRLERSFSNDDQASGRQPRRPRVRPRRSHPPPRSSGGPSQALEKNFDALINPADQHAAGWSRCRPRPTMSARRTTRPMPTCSWRCSSNGAGTRISSASTSSIRRRSRPRVELVDAASTSSSAGRSRRSPRTRPRRSTADALPPYVAYQGDGDVTAPVVYVNYGMPDDYDALEQRGISVKGKIVLARYGGGWRGLKPKLAQEHGAVGCLIYSDPADDGYAEADVYPKGGGRPEGGVQRGSVADMPTYPGDPLTPGVGATAERQAPDPRAGESPSSRSRRCRSPTATRPGSSPRCRGRWSPASSAAGSASPITGAAPTRSRSISRSSPTGR